MAYIDTSRLQKKAESLRQPRFGGSYASGLANALVGLKANRLDKKIEAAEEKNKANREREIQALLQAVSDQGQVGGLGPNMGIPQNRPASGSMPAALSQMQFTDPEVQQLATSTALSRALKEPKDSSYSPVMLHNRQTGEEMTGFRDSARPGFFDNSGRQLGLDSREWSVMSPAQVTGGRSDVIPTPADTDLKSSFAGLKMFNDTASQIKSIVQQDPSATTSWAALEAIGNSALANVRAMAGRIIPGQDLDVLDPSKYRSILGEKSEELAAFYTAAAFQMGSAFKQEGRSLTENDMKRFLKMVGAGTDDPSTALAILQNAQDTVNTQWQYNFESFNQGQPYDDRYGQLNYGQDAPPPPAEIDLTPEEVDAMTPEEALQYLKERNLL